MGEKLATAEHIKPIRKMFIAQRGEIAFRAARACAKKGVPAVIPYTFSDSNPLASELAEKLKDSGWELAALGGTSANENFTNPRNLIQTMKLHDCDAVFLGYGFLSEDSDFVRMCEEEGIRVLAPPSSVMEKTGNKISAREIAKRVKIGLRSSIPVLEGSENLPNFEQAHRAADRLGYPVMLKDPDLGGGKGNIVARNDKELESAYTRLKSRRENKEVFLERYVEHAVHVEVQIAADKYGNIVSLGERDCTLQRKSQKVIEESPSPHISNRTRQILQLAATRFAKTVGYQGVGTWEFLVDLDRKGRNGDPAWYFMEINPRIQVEHPVTEEQTRIDIVDLMIDIAEGKSLPFAQKDIIPQGHTIEARVYAENPNRGFTESFGTLSVLSNPEVEGVRIEPALREGDTLSFSYDTTLFKAIAHGSDRETARQKLVRLLSGSEIVGVSSNLHFLIELLATSQFQEGKVTTSFVEDWWKKRLRDRVHSIEEFINGGTFTEYPFSQEYNPALLPQTSTVIKREDGSKITYADHLERLRREKGTTCAAKYGIQERDGVRWVLYTLDYSINAGTLGPQEGNILIDASKLANQENLVLVTLISTGGVDNWTNALGLHQMGLSVAAVTEKYPPRTHINVSHGPFFGGVPASFAGIPDWQIMVDSEQSYGGLAGILLVARGMGINIPEGTKAPEIYEILTKMDERNKALHTPISHYQAGNVDTLVSSLGEASNRVTHLIHNLHHKEAITDPNRVYQPNEQIAFLQGSSEAIRPDRSGSHFPVWFSPVSRVREQLLKISTHSGREEVRELTNYERWKIIHEVDRPTAADLLDTRFGMFDDSTLLNGPILHIGNDEWYPSIIGAVCRIEDLRLLVVAQQTSRTIDEVTKKLGKKYVAQKPEDWESLEDFVFGIGLKNRLPVLFIGDTEGASADPDAEIRGQMRKIARTQKITNSYPFPTAALLLGFGGSGGVETIFRPMDGVAVAENSLLFVADPRPKSWIQGGHWLDDTTEEFKNFINGEETARAETLVQMGLADYIIKEGLGGAHRNSRLFARNARDWAYSTFSPLLPLSKGELTNRRWERNLAPNLKFSTPVS